MENINKNTGIGKLQDITEHYNNAHGRLTGAISRSSEIVHQESSCQYVADVEQEIKEDESPREKLRRVLLSGEKPYVRSDNTNITTIAPDDCAYITIPKGKLSLIGNLDEVDRIFNDSDISNIIARITASGELQVSEYKSMEDPNLLIAKREELKKKLLNGTTQTTGILRDSDISEDVDSISIPQSLGGARPVEPDGNSNTLREAKEEEWKAKSEKLKARREELKAKLLRGEIIPFPKNTSSNGNGSINIPKGGLFSGDPSAEDLERIKATRVRHIQHNHKDVPKEDVSIRLPCRIVLGNQNQRCK